MHITGMKCIITHVTGVRLLGDNLSVISLADMEEVVVANLDPGGVIRWKEGEWLLYVPVNAKLPDDVMQERGYWDEENQRGYLGGKKYNQVKKRNFGPDFDRVESRGLLFKLRSDTMGPLEGELYIRRGDREEMIGETLDLDAFLGVE